VEHAVLLAAGFEDVSHDKHRPSSRPSGGRDGRGLDPRHRVIIEVAVYAAA